MNGEIELDFSDSQIKRVEFDYKLLLLQHLNNISKLVTYTVIPHLNMTADGLDPDFIITVNNKIVAENLFLSVNMLESLLAPYSDEEYKTETKKLELPEENKDYYFSIKNFSISKLGFLLKLMDRKDLLLEQTKSVRL